MTTERWHPCPGCGRERHVAGTCILAHRMWLEREQQMVPCPGSGHVIPMPVPPVVLSGDGLVERVTGDAED